VVIRKPYIEDFQTTQWSENVEGTNNDLHLNSPPVLVGFVCILQDRGK